VEARFFGAKGDAMKKKKRRFTDGQIRAVLKEVEAGANVDEVCNERGISTATLAKWQSAHGGVALSEARRLKQLEEENRRLRLLVADLTLSNQALKLAVSKKW
jgi:putative transposase